MGETRILFSAAGDSAGRELWITGGGDATRLTDLFAGSGSSTPAVLGQIGKWVYFSADNGDGRDLYVLDTSTNHVTGIGPANSNPGYVKGVAGGFFLAMGDSTHGRELWFASAGGVSFLGDAYVDGDLSPGRGGALGSSVLFAGNDKDKGTELFISNGGQPTLLQDINSVGNSNPGAVGGFFTLGNVVLFDATGVGGTTLWSSSGGTATQLSTVEIPQDFFAYDDGHATRVLFNGQTPGGNTQYLYVTDGMSGGTKRVTDKVIDPYNFALYKGKVYFSGYDSAHGRELWVTDGTEGGTHLAVDLDYSPASSGASNLVEVNGRLLFSSSDQRLWSTDGTDEGTRLVRNFLDVGNFVVVGTKAYFVAYTSAGKYQIWTTDGTTATATNLVPGSETKPVLQAIIDAAVGNTPTNGHDALTGTSGADTIDGKKGNDTIFGGAGNDTLKGSDGNDKLNGESGNDSLNGGTGKDTLSGGSGHDKLTGGSSADHFVFAAGDSGTSSSKMDEITDFSHSAGDKIDLHLIDAKAGTSKNDAFTFIEKQGFHHVKGELNYKVSGGNAIVSGDMTGDGNADFSIKLDHVTSLHSGDFIT